MEVGAITKYIDVAQVVLYFFWAFFAGLLLYLRREDRREGYPLVSEASGKAEDPGPFWMADAKTFVLSDGRKILAPNGKIDNRVLKAASGERWSGAPLRPTGNPMLDGIGPGAYAERAKIADVTADGTPRIVPMRSSSHYSIATQDADPRGMAVFGADRKKAGEVVDAWVDRSDMVLRYFEIALDPAIAGATTAVHVLVPTNFVDIESGRRRMRVEAITASQFAAVPQLASPTTITFAEEDRICGYYGGGLLYATPARQEPLL